MPPPETVPPDLIQKLRLYIARIAPHYEDREAVLMEYPLVHMARVSKLTADDLGAGFNFRYVETPGMAMPRHGRKAGHYSASWTEGSFFDKEQWFAPNLGWRFVFNGEFLHLIELSATTALDEGRHVEFPEAWETLKSCNLAKTTNTGH